MTKRSLLVALACVAGALAVPVTASADHRHVIQLPDGSCVVLSKQGNEPFVTLPDASYNKNTALEPGSANPHPIHVHVHQGRPGDNMTIAVFGPDDPCDGDYVNAP